jgi:hypothetical protein
MQELTKKAITGLIWLQIIMAVMLFAPAWTLHFWEAWAFWLLFSVLSTVITFYFLKHDPGLVESRLKAGPTAEHEKPEDHLNADGHSLVRPHHRARTRTTLPFFAHSVGARPSRRCASRGGLSHRLSRAAGEQMGCQHYRSAAEPECHFDRTLRHRLPSNVCGRCVDDSCHAAGLGLALGLRVRGVALRHHRGAASRRGAVSLEELAR